MKLTRIHCQDPKFSLGHLVATPAVIASLHAAQVSPMQLLCRHVRGDWGEISEADLQSNNRALDDGSRLLSAYTLPTNVRVWIITEADRSATTILLPREY